MSFETMPHVCVLFINLNMKQCHMYVLLISKLDSLHQHENKSGDHKIANHTQSRLICLGNPSESRLISFLFQLADHVTDETLDIAKDVCPDSPLKRTVDEMRDAKWAN